MSAQNRSPAWSPSRLDEPRCAQTVDELMRTDQSDRCVGRWGDRLSISLRVSRFARCFCVSSGVSMCFPELTLYA